MDSATQRSQSDMAQTTPTTPNDMLDRVYRDLVGIHMAVAERTNDDKEVIPWVERELRSLVGELGAFRRARRSGAGQSAS